MENKEIYIDGVDVSGCEFYESNGMCSCSLVYYDYCKDFPNCVYKLSQQLKAKEQECEELKKTLSQYETDLSTKDCIVETCKAQYKELKAENKDLQEQIRKHNDDMFKNPPEKRFYCKGCTLPYISKKLKQTITEIKEIIQNQGHIDILEEQILQKISECEVVDE